MLFPKGGLSQIGAAGGAFADAEADEALLTSFQENLRGDIPLVLHEGPINDSAFAQACAKALQGHLETRGRSLGGTMKP